MTCLLRSVSWQVWVSAKAFAPTKIISVDTINLSSFILDLHTSGFRIITIESIVGDAEISKTTSTVPKTQGGGRCGSQRLPKNRNFMDTCPRYQADAVSMIIISIIVSSRGHSRKGSRLQLCAITLTSQKPARLSRLTKTKATAFMTMRRRYSSSLSGHSYFERSGTGE